MARRHWLRITSDCIISCCSGFLPLSLWVSFPSSIAIIFSVTICPISICLPVSFPHYDFVFLTVTMWLSEVLHVHLHVGYCLHLQAIVPGLGNLSCGWLLWEQMFLMPLVGEKLWKWLHKRDASCMTNQGRLVLRNSIGAISLRALVTWPVENKKSFHLIRLFPLENSINYRRKLLHWNICSRWPRTSLWKKKKLYPIVVIILVKPVQCSPYCLPFSPSLLTLTGHTYILLTGWYIYKWNRC